MNNNRTTVLACIDGSTFTNAVVDYAGWVATKVDAPLKVLHNIEHPHTPVAPDLSGSIGLGSREDLMEELIAVEERRSKLLKEQGKAMLTAAHQRATEARVSQVEELQRHGSLVDTLIEMEEEIRVLVVGVRGEGHQHKEARIGAQLESIIRAMHRPILVINRPFDSAPQRLMLAYDGSEAARKALDMVATSPLYRGMECHLVHVGKSGDADNTLLQQGAEQLRAAGLDVITANLDGDVEDALGEYQQNHGIELIVMGAFGHSRLRELLFGSVTIRMLSRARIPLLLLR